MTPRINIHKKAHPVLRACRRYRSCGHLGCRASGYAARAIGTNKLVCNCSCQCSRARRAGECCAGECCAGAN